MALIQERDELPHTKATGLPVVPNASKPCFVFQRLLYAVDERGSAEWKELVK